jgi:hypothetical protein
VTGAQRRDCHPERSEGSDFEDQRNGATVILNEVKDLISKTSATARLSS